MRSISSSLNTAQTAADRFPVARAIVRDMRLRFGVPPQGVEHWTNEAITNPWGFSGESSQLWEQDAVFGDQITLSNGKIVRVNAHFDRILRINWVDDPNAVAQWNNWVSLGLAVGSGVYPSQVGLVEQGGLLYIFYSRQLDGTATVVTAYRTIPITATRTSINFGAETIAYTNPPPGSKTYAPVSATEVYVANSAAGQVQFYRFAKDGASWTVEEAPLRLTGTSEHVVSSNREYASASYFDAFSLGSRTFMVYHVGYLGQCWQMEYKNGVWGNATQIVPDDYTAFRPYRVSVIEGRAWLTGRVERDNDQDYSPAWDAYLYSDDGENWTLLARDSYLTTTQVRGKLHLSGNWVYYAGMSRVVRAPATYLIKRASENPAKRLVIGRDMNAWADWLNWTTATAHDDFKSAGVSFPGAGTAPQLNLILANGDDSYNHSPKKDVLIEGADIRIDAGYVVDSFGTQMYAALLQANLDTVSRGEAPGIRTLQVAARCAQFKKLRDWTSAFYWPLMSQLKHHDPCDTMASLDTKSGDWGARSRNLLANPGFEGETGSEWSTYYTGAVDRGRLRERTKEDKWEGEWSYKISKYGTPSDKVGIAHSTFQAVAGKEFEVEAHIRALEITGGLQEVVLEASGGWGPGGSAQTERAVRIGASDGNWTRYSLTFTPTTSAAVTVRVYLGNCSDGVILVDGVRAYQSDLQVSFSEVDTDGIVFSTRPLDTADFDIRARMVDDATASTLAQSFGMGLVGAAADRDNLLLFGIGRYDTTYYAGVWKKRGGIYTRLALVDYAWASNTQYDLRFVQRGGHIWCYAKAASAGNWGAPLFTSAGYDHYVWDAGAHGALTPTDDGRGKVGMRCGIYPARFLAYGVDQYSRVLTVHRENVDNWRAFPATGACKIKLGEEVMTYEGRSGDNAAHPANFTGFLNASGAYSTISYNLWDGFPFTMSVPQGSSGSGQYNHWDHVLDLAVNPIPAAPDDAFNDYGVVFKYSGKPWGQWRVTDSFNPGHHSKPLANQGDYQFMVQNKETWPNGPGVNFNPNCARLFTDAAGSGHADTGGQANGAPNWHIFGVPHGEITADMGPALFSVSRAQDHTTAVVHPDRQFCRMLWDDELRVSQFVVYDFETDWSTERLIKRICAMTGVLDTQFVSAHSIPGPYALNGWAASLVGGFDRLNFDLTLTFPTPTTHGHGLGLRFRGPGANDGLEVRLVNVSGVQAIFLYSWVAGVATELESTRLLSSLGTGSNLLRLVVHGNWITIYINGAYQTTFYTEAHQDSAVNALRVTGNGSLALTNLRVPELDEWREAIRVDNNQGGMQALGLATADRPIRMISRSGNALKFSTFNVEERDYVGPNTDNSGAFGTELYSHAEEAQEGDLFSFVRLEADGILEMLEPGLLRDYGFLFTMLHMPKASADVAALMLARSFREMKEAKLVVSNTVGANLRFEPEDEYIVNYTTLDTGRVQAKTLIVNNIDFEIGPASFKMSVGARQWSS